MPPGLSWLVGGLVLLGLEAVVPGAFMMWLGLAAFGTGLITLAAGLPFQAEVAAFAVLAALSLTVALRVRRRTANSRLKGSDFPPNAPPRNGWMTRIRASGSSSTRDSSRWT